MIVATCDICGSDIFMGGPLHIYGDSTDYCEDCLPMDENTYCTTFFRGMIFFTARCKCGWSGKEELHKWCEDECKEHYKLTGHRYINFPPFNRMPRGGIGGYFK